MSPAEVDSFYSVEVGVVGDISSSPYERTAIASPRKSQHASKLRGLLQDEIEQYRSVESFPLKPQKIISDPRSVMGDDDIVISDVGAHKIWLSRKYPRYRPNTCIVSNGFASKGIAVPGAVAAKLVYPDRRVVAVTDDGVILMNSQELETASRVGAPFVDLILNDNMFGLIKWKQMAVFGRSAFVDFTNPDIVRYAESFGAKVYRIEKASELVPALTAALAWNTLAVIDCPIDFSENLKLTEALGALVCPT